MNTATFKLKDIFKIEYLKPFFAERKQHLLTLFSEKHYIHIKKTIMRFIECRDYKRNFAIFSCPICNHKAYRPHTCKSKLCPTCGKIYSIDITNNFIARMIEKKHRHILFTIPQYLWNYFIGNFEALSKASDKLYDVFKLYFDNNSISSFGFSVFIHTFGRDSKFNPHLHIIITEGGFSKKLIWKNLSYFHWQVFINSWKKILSDVLSDTLNNNKNLKNDLKLLWNEKSSVFFNVKGDSLKNPKATLKYLGRYLARPPIAEYRIISIINDEITFWFNDLKSKSKKTITMSIFDFIQKIILHIPPSNFKMIRHYGFYARRISQKIKNCLRLFKKKNRTHSFKKSWQQNIFEWIGFNPLICPNCNTDMVIESIIYKDKVYSFKT